jgi:Tfp pilus assembly protein PilW
MSNQMNRHSAARPAFAGFTLVETMVAIVIGMLATFIVMQIYAVSEREAHHRAAPTRVRRGPQSST